VSPVLNTVACPFAIETNVGLLAAAPDYPTHVDQLVRQVLLTAPGERIDRPDFGCGLRRLLFAPNSTAAATLAQVTVYEALNRWLASVLTVDDVAVESTSDAISVTVRYTLLARGEQRYLNITVGP
jgi:phage baseplate assembly protein W